MTIDERIDLFCSPTGKTYLRIGRTLGDGTKIWISRADISDDIHMAAILRETMRQAVDAAFVEGRNSQA